MQLASYKSKMDTSVGVCQREMGKIHAGRVTPSMVSEIVVPAYGGTQSLKVMEVASINAEDAHTLVIKPWDESIIGDIAKGINAAGLGLNAMLQGDVIRIKVPPLTEERRKELVKLTSSISEQGRVAVRQVRHEAMADLKSDFEKKVISEDEKFRLEKDIQKLTDDMIGRIDTMSEDKEKELMTV